MPALMRLFLFLLAVLVAARAEARPPQATTYEPYGLRVPRPEGWSHFSQRGTSGVEFTAAVFRGDAPGPPIFLAYVASAQSARNVQQASDAIAQSLAAGGATDIERGTGSAAGGEAPWIAGRTKNPWGTGKLAVRCYVRLEHGYVYALQWARAEDDGESEAALERIVRECELFEPVKPAADPDLAGLEALAKRCEDALEWRTSWSAAEKVAQREQKPVLVLFESYAGLDLAPVARTSLFADPDLATLVRERFVALSLGPGDDAPFREPDGFGMGPHSFGFAVLILDPGGRLIAESGVAEASYLDQFVRGVLAAHFPTRDPPERSLANAESAFRRGELALASELIARDTSPAARRLRAAVHRRERRGAEALAELERAQSGAGLELEPELACDEAVVRMRMEQDDEARTAFERVLRRWPASERAREAAYWLGALDVLRAGVDGTARWRTLAQEHPDSPWAWRAAAQLARDSTQILAHERLDWPEPDLVAATVELARAPVSLERARRDAIAWLVAHQRENGAWYVPMDAFSTGSNLYTPSVSALCGVALLANRSEKGAAKAIDRALEYALAEHRAGRLEPASDLAGVYSIWNRTYVAWLCARALRAKVGDAGELAPVLQALVTSIAASQDRRGGWPYVDLGGDPDGSGIDSSASFLTAAVVLALLDAREARARVPDDSLARALDFLERMREPDGTFRYMPISPGGRETIDPEACGRGPVCALALRRGGRADDALVERTLALFDQHRPDFRAEWGKELCHTGPTGFGAHYVFFNYVFAREALEELPPDKRARYRAALSDDVLAARLADGSFEDIPGLGRAYGTAMALMALR